jgi:phosphotransferase system  glucose/maltose/N-acetylglucosamine-specific IIC component
LVYTIHSYLGWLSVAIMGGLWPLLVMTGMHRVFTRHRQRRAAERQVSADLRRHYHALFAGFGDGLNDGRRKDPVHA